MDGSTLARKINSVCIIYAWSPVGNGNNDNYLWRHAFVVT